MLVLWSELPPLPAEDEYAHVDDLTDTAVHELVCEHARGRGSVRAALCHAARDFAAARGWERLGFRTVGDYTRERLGVSARELQDLAYVGESLCVYPNLEAALRWGKLPYSKVRLIARVAERGNVERWIAYAQRRPCGRLAKIVRRIERHSGAGRGAWLEATSWRFRRPQRWISRGPCRRALEKNRLMGYAKVP